MPKKATIDDKEKFSNLHIIIPTELKRKVVLLAESKNRSTTDVVIKALYFYLQNQNIETQDALTRLDQIELDISNVRDQIIQLLNQIQNNNKEQMQ